MRLNRTRLLADVIDVVPADPLVSLAHVRSSNCVLLHVPAAIAHLLAYFVIRKEASLLSVLSLVTSGLRLRNNRTLRL